MMSFRKRAQQTLLSDEQSMVFGQNVDHDFTMILRISVAEALGSPEQGPTGSCKPWIFPQLRLESGLFLLKILPPDQWFLPDTSCLRIP
jgi:hypothetical protein